MNLAHILGDAVAAHAERPALVGETGTLTYAEIGRRADAATALLVERGVEPGDRVALMLPNGPAFVAAALGTWRLGAILVPLNGLLAPPEVEARLEASTPRVFLQDEGELGIESEPSAGPLERAGADPAVILFTSGTSGRPKGAILTHGSLHAAARNAADALDLGPDDVVLGAAPFSHVLGLATGVLSTLLSGSAIAVVRRFEAERTLALMTETGTTILLGVPTMCIALCQAARSAERLPPVRIAHVGGAAVPVEVARDFERVFGGEVYEGYGLTELSGIATTYLRGQTPRPGSVGTPLGGTELRIVSLGGKPLPAGEVGEVQFRGPSVIPGYWEDPQATAETIDSDRWLSTSDLGYVDGDGYLFLVDRKKDLILRGGYSVYPREVEEALYAHPDVLEAAVVGIPDETLGEEVAAVVVARPGASPSADEIQAWTKERVAAYKYPRRVIFVEELPKGPTGKILKRAIDTSTLV
ncbi:MAG TPA: AMP-binding protein [Gaiellaceae bacterium]|nr:AMP-binding protein [Gaiellaceae bacterium]